MIYYGCISCLGHRLFNEDGGTVTIPTRRTLERVGLYPECDGGFCPAHSAPQGTAKLTHHKGWTILSFWDNTVDTRPGSSSTFMHEGTWGFGAMAALAKKKFPQVWARFDFDVVEDHDDRTG